jgi:hypothetical protein
LCYFGWYGSHNCILSWREGVQVVGATGANKILSGRNWQGKPEITFTTTHTGRVKHHANRVVPSANTPWSRWRLRKGRCIVTTQDTSPGPDAKLQKQQGTFLLLRHCPLQPALYLFCWFPLPVILSATGRPSPFPAQPLPRFHTSSSSDG